MECPSLQREFIPECSNTSCEISTILGTQKNLQLLSQLLKWHVVICAHKSDIRGGPM